MPGIVTIGKLHGGARGNHADMWFEAFVALVDYRSIRQRRRRMRRIARAYRGAGQRPSIVAEDLHLKCVRSLGDAAGKQHCSASFRYLENSYTTHDYRQIRLAPGTAV